LEGEAKTRSVYLPKRSDWFDFWTGEICEGGQNIVVGCSIERLPLFVRAGSILPMTEVMQYVDEVRDARYEIHIYTGKDAKFALYEDAGDGYGYEDGERSFIRMRWHQNKAELMIERREGRFPDMIEARDCDILFVAPDGCYRHGLRYTGDEVRVQLGEVQR
jgi:alpha-D-xyloside xylohydrolase